MKYLLRTAAAAIVVAVSVGTTFGQVAPTSLVQFNPGTLASMQAGADSALVLSSVTIYPGAQLDLTSGGAVLDASQFTYYAPNGSGGYAQETGETALNDALANIQGSAIQGQPGVFGDQTNGILSSANINGNNGFVGTIGLANAGYTTSWRGVDLTQAAVTGMADPWLVGYTYAGDLYMEGYSDPGDIGTVNGNIASGATNIGWAGGDIYYEGYADPGDIGTINSNIASQPAPLYPVPASQGGTVGAPTATAQATPEPGSLALVAAAIGTAGFLTRRRLKASSLA